MPELRQHASRYLARAAAGETVQITDRGRPVARLVPPVAGSWDGLIASGRVLPPQEAGHVLDEPPADHAVPASANLARLREHER